jgi:pimeloyl-ACP methyl ester carboxylesterase
VVQVILSSSYTAYGISSLQQDSEEMAALLNHAHMQRKSRIMLLGHSTGCQDLLWYLQNQQTDRRIVAAILQGALSDRDYIQATLPNYNQMLEWAEEQCGAGRPNTLYNEVTFGAPMTAYRLRSLMMRLGDDDYFSLDFSAEERRQKFGGITVPIYIVLGAEDEYAPYKEKYLSCKQSYMDACEMVKEVLMVPGANHAFSQAQAQECLCNLVIRILRIE